MGTHSIRHDVTTIKKVVKIFCLHESGLLGQVCAVRAGTVKEAKFPELQFSCGYALNNINQRVR